MRVFDLLKKQHREVEALFGQIERARRPEKKQELLHKLAENLLVHMMVEEEIIYPLGREVLKNGGVDIVESVEEHLMGRTELHRLIGTPPSDSETFQARLNVTRQLIMTHIKDEERYLFREMNTRLRRDDQRIMQQVMGLDREARRMNIVEQTFGGGRRRENGRARRGWSRELRA